MTKAATVAFLLPFDLGLHPGVAKKKFHHIVNTTNISDFAGPSHMQNAIKKDSYRSTCLEGFRCNGLSRQCHLCQDSVIFASDPRVIQRGNRG